MTQVIDQPNTVTVLIDAPPYLELQQEVITVNLIEGLTVIDGAAQGQRGPAGTPRIEVPFSFGDATPLTLFTARADKLIQQISVFINEPFDGLGPMLTIGDTDNPSSLMTAVENNPAEEAVYRVTPNLSYEADTQVLLFITPGPGASQGSGLVVVETQN